MLLCTGSEFAGTPILDPSIPIDVTAPGTVSIPFVLSNLPGSVVTIAFGVVVQIFSLQRTTSSEGLNAGIPSSTVFYRDSRPEARTAR